MMKTFTQTIKKTEGWDVWGNEVESDIALSSLDKPLTDKDI